MHDRQWSKVAHARSTGAGTGRHELPLKTLSLQTDPRKFPDLTGRRSTDFLPIQHNLQSREIYDSYDTHCRENMWIWPAQMTDARLNQKPPSLRKTEQFSLDMLRSDIRDLVSMIVATEILLQDTETTRLYSERKDPAISNRGTSSPSKPACRCRMRDKEISRITSSS